MYASIAVLITFLFITGCSSQQVKHYEETYQQPSDINMVVIAEDQSLDNLPRKSRQMKRVESRLSNALVAYDYSVYDLMAVTDEQFERQRDNISDEELMDYFLTQSKPKMDIAVMYRVYYRIDRSNDRLSVGIKGRLLNIKSGQMIGATDIPGAFLKLADNCRGACIQTEVSDKARMLAPEFAEEISLKLSRLINPDTRNTKPVTPINKAKPKPTTVQSERVDGIYVERNEASTPAPTQTSKPQPKPAPSTSTEATRVDGILIEKEESSSNSIRW